MILSSSVVAQLAASTPSIASVPYDRSKIDAGIAHVGVGNFHRAHMAVYLDDLLRQDDNGNDSDGDESGAANNQWGLLGAGVMPDHEIASSCLQKQDCLWTVITRNAQQAEPRIVGSMVECLDYSAQHEPLRKALLSDKIRIVSLTVTEGGYFLHDGKFDPEHPKIQADVQNPDQPTTIFGVMIQALKERRANNIPPFTILSCDNVPHNGDVAKTVTLGMARLMDPELADWMEQHVSFPNSMVDRITPATTPEERKTGTLNAYGYADSMPVYCEPFRQWVLEDNFCNGRPALEKVGVQFVPDVTPYEKAKIRILNGGHASLCYPAALLGLDYVHQAMEHPVLSQFLNTLERTEIVPGVPAVPDTDLVEYWETIQNRFANPTIQDSIARNCYDGASRQPKFIIPGVLDNLQAGRSVSGLALVSALWCRYCFGLTETGQFIQSNDPAWERLHAIALEANDDDPQAWLNMLPDVYGKEVAESPVFGNAFAHALRTIKDKGVEGAMKDYVDAVV